MGRIQWLNWRLRYGNPKTRPQNLTFFLGFELYNLGCVLSGYRISHWLDQRPSRTAGKYLRVVRSAPFLVRLMDRRFSFGEESHSDYLTYTPEAEEKLRLAGERVSVVEISYRLGAESY